jgi:hypothetical protein
MIARVRVLLPFVLYMKKDEVLAPIKDEVDGCLVTIHPPYQASPVAGVRPMTDPLDPAGRPEVSASSADGVPIVTCNVLQIDLRRDQWNRREGAVGDLGDLADIAFMAANGFLARVRVLTHASPVQAKLDAHTTTWLVRFLNDDGSEFDAQEGLVRGFARLQFQMAKGTLLHPKVWEAVQRLPLRFEQPPHLALILDAFGLLPDVGPAIVLAATAIEVRVTTAVDLLANGRVDSRLWEWINDRGNFTKEPSVVERFDPLLAILAGRRLKEDNPDLWTAFKRLKDARNNFVHEGRAVAGRDERPVTAAEAGDLLQKALKVLEWIEEQLPEEHRSPVPPTIAVAWQLTKSFPV